MQRHRNFYLSLALISATPLIAACQNGPPVAGAFDRNYTVSGPIRVELNNASGDVDITGSADGKVHVHGAVRASGFGSESSQKRLDDTLANPPVEQKGDTIRIGKDYSRMRNVSIAYSIQVPRDTEVSANVASGAQTIRNVRGPVKVQAASGSIRVEKIVNAIAGVIRISKPGGRVEADTASGAVDVNGAASDVKAHAASGRVSVQGNPGADSYWELKTISGGVQLVVPASANLHLSAEAASGEIRTDIPIVIEEQGKHSLRAHLGNGGGRVEVHTVSGEIHVSGSN